MYWKVKLDRYIYIYIYTHMYFISYTVYVYLYIHIYIYIVICVCLNVRCLNSYTTTKQVPSLRTTEQADPGVLVSS